MRYSVKRQYLRGPEQLCAEFRDLPDARLFIQCKLEAEKAMNIQVTYQIYETDEVIEVLNTSQIELPTQNQGTQGKGQSASFRPTPLNTTPRPPGTPPKWLIEDEDENSKK